MFFKRFADMYYILNYGQTFANLKLLATFIILCAICFCQCAFTLSHKNLESEVENYINSINTLEANFVQIATSETSYGKLYIQKPGKIRIEYREPQNYVIVVQKNRTTYYNYDLEEYANFANKSNFLSVVSNENFSFSEFDEYNIVEEGGIVSASMKLHDKEEQSVRVSLNFNRISDGLKFDSFYINDGVSPESVVKLQDIKMNQPIDKSKFRLRNPNFFKK